MSRGLRFRDWHLDLNAAGIPRAPEDAGFAPYRGFPGCIDREGRVRAVHFHDADSVCVYCGHVLIEAEAL